MSLETKLPIAVGPRASLGRGRTDRRPYQGTRRLLGPVGRKKYQGERVVNSGRVRDSPDLALDD
jgi:hypothetical protein